MRVFLWIKAICRIILIEKKKHQKTLERGLHLKIKIFAGGGG
jgi:hypothetical protein